MSAMSSNKPQLYMRHGDATTQSHWRPSSRTRALHLLLTPLLLVPIRRTPGEKIESFSTPRSKIFRRLGLFCLGLPCRFPRSLKGFAEDDRRSAIGCDIQADRLLQGLLRLESLGRSRCWDVLRWLHSLFGCDGWHWSWLSRLLLWRRSRCVTDWSAGYSLGFGRLSCRRLRSHSS